MTLTEVVLMVQNELQKSYDYLRITAAQSQLNGNTDRFIHMNFNEVEIEIPLIIELKERSVTYESLQELPDTLKFMKIPFNLDFQLNQFSTFKKEQTLTQEEDIMISKEKTRVNTGEIQEEGKIQEPLFMVGNETNVRFLTDKDFAIQTENHCKVISTIKIKFRPVI